ncbi:MAG: GntR family transcriptional regulator [Acidobacteria bacterium]|nr:MAG: GntR family transcriptional regulator [Acidobacteriota bacterium]
MITDGQTPTGAPALSWMPPLDPTSPAPIYEQILEGVALAVAAGQLAPGALLPSVRSLATALRLNPNTTARALRAVERAGLARAVRGVGMVVADDGRSKAAELARRALERELASAVRVARQLGMERPALVAALERVWQENGHADRG